jgi:hypothetical protein
MKTEAAEVTSEELLSAVVSLRRGWSTFLQQELKAGLVRRKGQIDVVGDGWPGGVLSEFGRAVGPAL